MKTIVFDARMVGPTGHGISKYVEGVLAQFADGDPLTRELLAELGVSSVQEVRVLVLIRPVSPKDSIVRQFQTVELDHSCYHPSSWLAVPKVLRDLGADLFFNPTFASFPFLPCPFVQTVHDLNHLHFGRLSHRLYYTFLLKRSIRKARRVFTVSRAMQTEIAAWAGAPAEKIRVFYNQFDPVTMPAAEVVEQTLRDFGLTSKRYYFCVTNPKPHKNTRFLLRAYAAYQGHVEKLDGDGREWKREFEQNQRHVGSADPLPLVITLSAPDLPVDVPLKGIIPVGGLSNQALNILYQHCAGFYSPSLYEGFGRPPVEAALAGVDYIVVSDIPAHHEAESLTNTRFRLVKV